MMQLYISVSCKEGRHDECESVIACMCPCHKKQYSSFAEVHRQKLREEKERREDLKKGGEKDVEKV